MSQSPSLVTRVTPEMYSRVFEHHEEGKLILEDLTKRFYDVSLYVPGGMEGARETERNAARREVVWFILAQLARAGSDDNEGEAA